MLSGASLPRRKCRALIFANELPIPPSRVTSCDQLEACKLGHLKQHTLFLFPSALSPPDHPPSFFNSVPSPQLNSVIIGDRGGLQSVTQGSIVLSVFTGALAGVDTSCLMDQRSRQYLGLFKRSSPLNLIISSIGLRRVW